MAVRVWVLAAVLVGAWTARAHGAEIVVLKSIDTPSWRPAVDAFVRKAALRHHVTEVDLRGDRAEAEKVLGAIKDQDVVLVAVGPLAAQSARELAPERPLVFCMVQDPSTLGLSRKPRVAGIAFSATPREQIAAIRLVTPTVLRVGVMYGSGPLQAQMTEVRAAVALELRLVERQLGSSRDVPRALRELLEGAKAVDALWLPPDPILLDPETRRFVLSETLKAGKPVFTFSSSLLAEGALASVGPGATATGELAADLADRLATGDRTAFGLLLSPPGELALNRRVAAQLRIDLSSTVLAAARQVF
jgi:putative ABC transport system substrate-binding protein